MRLFLTVPLSVLVTCLCACCQSRPSSQTPSSSAALSQAELKQTPPSAWQQWLLTHFKTTSSDTVEVWALFSSGGFAGVGEGNYVLSVTNQDLKSARLRQLPAMPPPSLTDKLTDARLESTALQVPLAVVENFISSQKTFPEKNFHTEGIFDTFSYEYIHALLQAGKVISYSSLQMDAPYHETQSSAPHQLILSAFATLKDKAEAAEAAKAGTKKR